MQVAGTTTQPLREHALLNHGGGWQHHSPCPRRCVRWPGRWKVVKVASTVLDAKDGHDQHQIDILASLGMTDPIDIGATSLLVLQELLPVGSDVDGRDGDGAVPARAAQRGSSVRSA